MDYAVEFKEAAISSDQDGRGSSDIEPHKVL
jgi:hypothetical protein